MSLSQNGNVKFAWIINTSTLVVSIFYLSCNFEPKLIRNSFSSWVTPIIFKSEEESMGFRIEVDFGEDATVYKFKTHLTTIDVVDLFSELSLQENPPMRFITTKSSIEIYDILGTRNNFQKEWSVYINGKWISGDMLKKGVLVDWNSRIAIRYGKAYRIITPREKPID